MQKSSAFIAGLALVFGLAACSKSETPKAPATVDLSESKDLFSQPIAGAPQPLSGVIATVNGHEITAEDFTREVNTRLAMLRQRMPPEQIALVQADLRKQVLDQMIARRLLLDEAARLGLKVSDEELAQARSELEEMLPPGASLDQLLAARGITEEIFRREFTDDLLVRKVIDLATREAAPVSEEEVEKFYEEHREQFTQPEMASARHLLVAVNNPEEKEEKRAKAEALRQRLLAGEDFATLVRKESDDPGSRETGGLYTFPRGQMVPEFEEASFTQPIGEIGELVETRFGFHIIKVEERQPEREIPLAEVRTNVAAFLRNQKAPNAVRELIEKLRAKADIQIKQPI